MRADQLQRAASSVTKLLKNADLLTIIRECRGARDEQLAVSLARLGNAGASVMKALENANAAESQLLKATHLDALATPAYWRNLVTVDVDEKKRQADLVQLYSRVMFATGHLPSLVNLIDHVDVAQAPGVRQAADGEETLTIRLTDAGEKASDPDRLARAIDGIDMLYSACASLARKPAIDLQLLAISGDADRDITFLGDIEAIQAVKTVIESIPDVVAEINPEDDLDIQQLVRTLPVFDDLQTLRKLGTFSPADLQDIEDTMHQGVLLSLESGVMLIGQGQALDEQSDSSNQSAAPASIDQADAGRDQGSSSSNVTQLPGHSGAAATSPSKAPERDEHYEQYLRERDKLMSDDTTGTDPTDVASMSQSERNDAINNLLKGLKNN